MLSPSTKYQEPSTGLLTSCSIFKDHTLHTLRRCRTIAILFAHINRELVHGLDSAAFEIWHLFGTFGQKALSSQFIGDGKRLGVSSALGIGVPKEQVPYVAMKPHCFSY
jgi:hypothetical protein